jgi:O-antigen/teichoic acid export membrane protein
MLTGNAMTAPLAAVRQTCAIIRFRPFDSSTAEGRSKERYRRAFLTTLTSGFARCIGIATVFISVPLTLKYLGTERYGLWMAISSAIMILGFSDLGINNGLLNGIAQAHGKGDRELARRYVSSAFFSLTAVAILIGVIFAVVYRWIPWGSVFRVTSPRAIAEGGPAMAAFTACFLCTIPAGIATRVQLGYQEGFTANLWTSLGSVLSLLSLLIVIRAHGSLLWLVLAMAGAPIVSLIGNGAYVLAQRPWLCPSWSHVKADVTRSLLRSGLVFLVLQLAIAIGFSSDNLVLVRVLGPDAVTQYSVPSRLFSVVAMLCSMLMAPLWPAYGEALARKDHAWARRALIRALVLSAGVSLVMSSLLVVFGPALIHWWAGPSITPSRPFVLGLGFWGVLAAMSSAPAAFLNGVGRISFQAVVASIATPVNIGLSVFLTHRIGVPGVLFGSILSQMLIVLPPYYVYIRRYLRSSAT